MRLFSEAPCCWLCRSLADRAAFHNAVRAAGPVAKVEPAGYYLLTGYAPVKALLDDHERFSKAEGNQFAPEYRCEAWLPIAKKG